MVISYIIANNNANITITSLKKIKSKHLNDLLVTIWVVLKTYDKVCPKWSNDI